MEWLLLGILEDFHFVLQIVILLTISNFVLNHLGKTWTSYLVIGGVAAVVFFVIPVIAEGAFLLYMLLMAGVSTMLVDFFFITAGVGGAQQPGAANVPPEELERSRGLEVHEQTKQMQHMHAQHGIAHRAAGMAHNMMARMRR